ncbi:MAG: cupin domain-containing protein [Solirubrobacteraceae bacterium]
MGAYRLSEIDAMASLHGGAVKLAAAELAIESFGMQLLDLPPGFDDYPEHDHADDAMEEVYVTLSGSGTFEIDGRPVPIDPSMMLRIAPAARRRLEPGPDGVRVLAIGNTVGRPYERPPHFRLEVRA